MFIVTVLPYWLFLMSYWLVYKPSSGVFPDRGLAAALAGPANRCARLAADHMLLKQSVVQMDSTASPRPYPGSLGTAIVRVFDAAVRNVHA